MQVTLSTVGYRFGTNPWLFRNLSAVLMPSRTYALVGPSGSGKSTLLSLLAGWVFPAEGSISLQDVDKTAWVFQNPNGVGRRSVLDHVSLPFLARGEDFATAESAAHELLERFRLHHLQAQPFQSLSGGESQRLMLARGLATRPGLLLIDEPTAQLDLDTRREVNDVIQALRDEGTIVVIATHDDETRQACTDVIDLRNYRSAGDEIDLSGDSR